MVFNFFLSLISCNRYPKKRRGNNLKMLENKKKTHQPRIVNPVRMDFMILVAKRVCCRQKGTAGNAQESFQRQANSSGWNGDPQQGKDPWMTPCSRGSGAHRCHPAAGDLVAEHLTDKTSLCTHSSTSHLQLWQEALPNWLFLDFVLFALIP